MSGTNKPVTNAAKDVNGHEIEYQKVAEREQVKIDGNLMPFFRVGSRYLLEVAAYDKAQDSLLEAAEQYARRMPPPSKP